MIVADAWNHPNLAAFFMREVIEPLERIFAGALVCGMARGACLAQTRRVDSRGFIRHHLALMLRDLARAPDAFPTAVPRISWAIERIARPQAAPVRAASRSARRSSRCAHVR